MLGVGILSWKGYESLEASLATYNRIDMLGLFDEAVAYLPEAAEPGPAICRAAGVYPVEVARNGGILAGFEGLARSMSSEIVLLLENDFQVIVGSDEAKRQILHSKYLIESGTVRIVRLRSLTEPGEPFVARQKFNRYFPARGAGWQKRLKATVRRLLRPKGTMRALGQAVLHDQKLAAERGVARFDEEGFGLTTSRYISWTNNPVMMRREDFLESVIEVAKAANTRRRVNGAKNIEIEMNAPHWRDAEIPIAVAPGIFTHRRVGSRGY
jgi:hypothetical protein